MKFDLTNESGVTAIEYGILAALIAVVIIVAVTAAGGALSDVFDNVRSALSGLPTGA